MTAPEIPGELDDLAEFEAAPCRVRAHVAVGVVEIDATGVCAELVAQLVGELWCVTQPVKPRSNWQIAGREGAFSEDAFTTTDDMDDDTEGTE